MGKPRLKLHIMPCLRWDREGLRTFQESRLNLVQLLDHLLTVFAARPRFESLVLGGQTILIEDYLEVRSQNRVIISEMAQSGRFYAGPWHVSPNEFLVSPEALVRNLLRGKREALSLGLQGEMGYMPDGTAHIGQLPQVLRGFGLECATIAHSSLADIHPEKWWLAPDGSGLLIIDLYEESDGRLGQSADRDTLVAALARIKDGLKEHRAAHTLAVLYEGKSGEPLGQIADLIDSLEGELRGVQIVHGDLPGYLAEVAEAADGLPGVAGEMLPAQLTAGCLSTHIWVKQYNHDVQTLLERWAEPFGAWVGALDAGGAIGQNECWLHMPDDLIRHAWQILLPNHAYASISGHVVDQVHREMQVRFDQAAQIGAEIVGQSISTLADQIDTSGLLGDEQQSFVIAFNGTGQAHTDIVTLGLPSSRENEVFQVRDLAGASVPIENRGPFEEAEGDTRAVRPRCVTFIAHDIPAYGYRTYLLCPMAGEVSEAQCDDNPTIENQHLGVSIDPAEGTFSLFDKRTGRLFERLNRYVDGGDCGDATAYRPPSKDTLIDIATNMPLQVERRISDVQQELSYLQIFRLPQQLTLQRDARLPLAAQFVPISIMTTLRLANEVPRLDIEVEVSNNALDHRLRVHFPTGMQTPEALFDGHFEIVRRPVPGDYPQRAFVTVMGTDTGLTIANRGLPEVAVLSKVEGVEIALTLLRSIGWLQLHGIDGTQGEGKASLPTPGAQCRGTYRFSYSLIPHGQDPLPAWHQAWAFQAPLRSICTSRHPGALPVDHSLVAVDNPAFVLSTVKTAEDGKGLIVRGYNISDSVEQVTLRLGIGASRAQFARIDETPTGTAIKPDSRGRYKFKVRPAEIVTLHFATGPASSA